VLCYWKEREPIYRRRRRLAMEDHDGVVPAFAEASLGTGDGDGARRPSPKREPAAPPVAEHDDAALAGTGAAGVEPAGRPAAGDGPTDGGGRRRLGRAGRPGSETGAAGERSGADGPKRTGDGASGSGETDGPARGARAARRRRRHGR